MAEVYPRLVQTDRGYTVFYKNRYLYSKRSPIDRTESIAKQADIPPQSLVIIPSPVLFYGVGHLLHTLPASCHVLCLETDQILMAFSTANITPELANSRRFDLMRVSDPRSLIEHIESLGTSRFRRIVSLPLTGGYQLNRDLYDAMISGAEHHIRQHWQNRITLMHMGRLWIKNLVFNLARYWRDLSRPAPTTDKPIVVIGAGASIEDVFDMLRAFRDGLYLLAVDTALPALSAVGIEPDAAVVLEAQQLNASDFLGHGSRKLTLICDITSHPSTLGAVRCKRHFVCSRFADIALLDRLRLSGLTRHSLRPLGSVGLAAVELAKLITTGPIFLTGLDFSYLIGKPHSRGAPSHILTLSKARRTAPPGWFSESMKRPLITAPAKNGELVTTDLVLHSYGENLAKEIAGDRRIFDLGSRGIPLGVETVSTADQLGRIISSSVLQGVSRRASDERPGQRTTKSSVEAFLSNEQGLIEGFLNEYNASRKRTEAIASRIAEVNYVYLDFPDAERDRELSDDFLVRAAASASYYLKYVKIAREMLR